MRLRLFTCARVIEPVMVERLLIGRLSFLLQPELR